jgi:methylthioribose-1-phosphate isomerase
MTGLTSIRTSGNSKIEIVDQLLLPHTTEFIEIGTIEQAHDAIKSMKVLMPFISAVREVF